MSKEAIEGGGSQNFRQSLKFHDFLNLSLKIFLGSWKSYGLVYFQSLKLSKVRFISLKAISQLVNYSC